MELLQVVLEEHGSQVYPVLTGILGIVLGFFTSRQKQNNHFFLGALEELNEQNKDSKAYLTRRLIEKEKESDEQRRLHIDCERKQGLAEVEIETLKRDLDLLISVIDKPVLLKELILDSKKRKRRIFKYVNMDDILAKIETIPHQS